MIKCFNEVMVTENKHYLFPSELFAKVEPHMIDTVLGSCVSVCLFDKRLLRGGINHYLLPLWNGDGLASPKYGNIAIEKLFEKMMVQGSKREDLVAKIFGGSNQMNTSLDIGTRNIQIADQKLYEMDLKVVARNVGGTVGRKIRFNSGTGEVLLKLLR
jgi:chemotaxis protein CheD